MNLRELARITTPSLPNARESAQIIISKTNDAIKEAFKRDGDKEQRIRKLEELLTRGTGKFSTSKNFGATWRIIDLEDGTGNLYVQHSADGGSTWNTRHTFTP